MLCCRCNKNLAVVYISNVNPDGTRKNEGYCLSCARKLNIGPVDAILDRMGVDPEEMDRLNIEMMNVVDEMGDDFNLSDSINLLREELSGDADIVSFEEDDDDDEDIEDIIEAEETKDPKDTDEDNAEKADNGGSHTHTHDDDEHTAHRADTEPFGRSAQRDPFEFISRFMGGSRSGGRNDSGNADSKSPRRTREKNKKKSMLDTFGINLTRKALSGEIDAVIGRDKEIERTMQILNRRTKNNPCLIGEPGVGKTAIAEGLALKIVMHEVPQKLMNYEIYLLDMTSVVAGTQFRGQFEARLRNIIEEVKRAGNIILVIDEIHTIASAGDAEGGMNAGNILKPALSKGEIQVIGATTIDEYRKYIEKDAALERRFQTVMIDEPTLDETIEILKGIRPYYEEYHCVKLTDEIIRTAAILSDRYIRDRFLPDKAIDVIDEAASKVNLGNTDLIELEELEREIDSIREEKDKAAEKDDYETAADLKVKELQLEARIKETEQKAVKYVEPEDIAAVIETWTKIPVKHISEYESQRLADLENRLHKGVIGQDKAIRGAASAIRRKRAGINLKRRPVSFIFVGPTGVGKTELAKQIAREVFDGEDSLIRLDMSEYMEKHSVSKLIGSPPGYVGYDEAGQLTEKIRRRPYSVILLDEIEKAHQDIFNILLQILDDGRITDSHGRVVSFENTIIIMTSNAGSDKRSNVVGFNESDEAMSIKIDRALKELFRPEFLNRVDDIIIFSELKRDELVGIADLMLEDLRGGLREKDITLDVTDEAKRFIADNAGSRQYGARPMRRYIEKNIEDILAQKLIGNEINHGDTVKVCVKDEKLDIEIKS